MRNWTMAALAAGTLLAAAWSSESRAETMTFAMQPFPPFAIDDHGAAQGVFPELLQRVCEMINATCRIEIYPWRRAMLMAEQGFVDGILVVQDLPAQHDAFFLTDPIVQSSFGVFASGKRLAGQYRANGAQPVGALRKIAYGIGLSRKRFDAARAGKFNAALRELIRNGTLYAIAQRAGIGRAAFAAADAGS